MKVFLQVICKKLHFQLIKWIKNCRLYSFLHFPHKILYINIVLIFCLLCTSCNTFSAKKPISRTGFYFDTVITIQIFDKKDEKLLDSCMDLCSEMEKTFSKTDQNSELYRLNNDLLPKNEDNSYTISPDLYAVLDKGMEFSQKTGNLFSICLGTITNLWDFGTQTASDTPKTPSADSIKTALTHTNTDSVILLTENRIQITDSDMDLDLGGIAKGYIADKLKAYLVSEGVKSAIIDLGGNLVCIGSKNNQPYTIGIQRPFADRSETIATMKITDKSVVSSGIYERYFMMDDVLYHHILDPATGYPYENDLLSVTIVAEKSVDADALSTSAFALGLENGLQFIEEYPGADAVFITKDGNLHYTEDFENKYHVK